MGYVPENNKEKRRNKRTSKQNKGNNFPCIYCKKIYPKYKDLRGHLSAHSKRAHLCDFCPSAFSEKKQLKEHKKQHQKDKERTFECKLCRELFGSITSFSNQSTLTLHKKRVHKINEKESSQNKNGRISGSKRRRMDISESETESVSKTEPLHKKRRTNEDEKEIENLWSNDSEMTENEQHEPDIL